MMLRSARARYSAEEVVRGGPAAQEYAAARRWLSRARDAILWAGDSGDAVWLAKACDALVRADGHRAAARRWRGATGHDSFSGPGVDEEALAFESRLREDARSRASIRAYYSAARHALALARVYGVEPGTSGRREREIAGQVSRYRAAIRDLRLSLRSSALASRPGLSKTGSHEESAGERDRAAG